MKARGSGGNAQWLDRPPSRQSGRKSQSKVIGGKRGTRTEGGLYEERRRKIKRDTNKRGNNEKEGKKPEHRAKRIALYHDTL